MKKVYAFLAKRQYFFLPLVVLLSFQALFETELLSTNIFEEKIDTIISLSGVFIGVLLAIFTLYASIPKDSEIMQRVIAYGHHQIFKKSILYGCGIFIINNLLWLFDFSNKWIVITLLMGLSEVLITIRYIYLINDYV